MTKLEVPKIAINGIVVKKEKLFELGFALVGLGHALERCEVQIAQAVARPTDKEVSEAERAISHIERYVRNYEDSVNSVRGPDG